LLKRHWGLGVPKETKEEQKELVKETKEGRCKSFNIDINALCGVVKLI
jgi:hypothetical protein